MLQHRGHLGGGILGFDFGTDRMKVRVVVLVKREAEVVLPLHRHALVTDAAEGEVEAEGRG